MIDEVTNESFEDGFDKDEAMVLKYALVDFNHATGLGWTMGDLDFIVSFPGPLTKSWYDKFNIYVQGVIDKFQEGILPETI